MVLMKLLWKIQTTTKTLLYAPLFSAAIIHQRNTFHFLQTLHFTLDLFISRSSTHELNLEHYLEHFWSLISSYFLVIDTYGRSLRYHSTRNANLKQVLSR
uniref:Uncharacterized protein n=1 Tax=Helianthus annuus TaxID=4232 RepID=A0A251TLH2_HELAN